MKIKLNYDEKIINVPAEAVMDNIGSMTANELKVLIYICSEPSFRADTDAGRAYAIKTLDLQWAEIEEAISSLSAHGVISADIPADAAVREARPKKKASVRADSPVYSKDETAGIIGRNEDLHRIINSDVPRLTGKAVSQNEAMILVSLYDYLRLDPECIVKIIGYCRDKGSVSFRVVERTAYSLFDANITTPEAIDEFIEREKKKTEITEKIRGLFGIGNRSLITHEKTLIDTWTEKYGYGEDIISRAYEATIKSINEPSLDYAGAIMKRWFEAGVRTPDDIENISAPASEKKTKKTGKRASVKEAESFDADDFVKVAMRRSYGEE